jgi:hypothetical protein
MWYLTKTQWLVIWLTTLFCLVGWLASDPEPQGFILPAMLVGGLFIWQVSQGEEPSR